MAGNQKKEFWEAVMLSGEVSNLTKYTIVSLGIISLEEMEQVAKENQKRSLKQIKKLEDIPAFKLKKTDSARLDLLRGEYEQAVKASTELHHAKQELEAIGVVNRGTHFEIQAKNED